MPFNSLKYFLFLPVVYLLFYFVCERARWCVLLAASLLFYAALKVPYLLFVLPLVAITTYGFGIWLDHVESQKAKRTLLWSGIAANVLILIAMKYLPFLSENMKLFSALFSLDVHIQPVKAFVAIGVSYYVFQAISYLLDIYLEIEKPERHFGYFALYMAFFPKLLQGPIERVGDLMPQLKTPYEFNYDNMRFGMVLFTWGLFKKVVIADHLALLVDPIYSNVYGYKGLPLILATYYYAIQIYCDFSGYTDMALGSARIFNINLAQNFNNPYLATSIADFWRRWHISFSRWILDYIFKPLQMSWRNWRNCGTAMALVVTFLVSGIWHGASWSFIVWGLLHGIYLAFSVLYKPIQKRIYQKLGIEKSKITRFWQIIVTFNLVSFAWIFFRANNFKDALYVCNNFYYGLFDLLLDLSIKNIFSGRYNLTRSLGPIDFVLLLAVITLLLSIESKKDFISSISSKGKLGRWSVYLGLIFMIVFLGMFKGSQFIYFRF